MPCYQHEDRLGYTAWAYVLAHHAGKDPLHPTWTWHHRASVYVWVIKLWLESMQSFPLHIMYTLPSNSDIIVWVLFGLIQNNRRDLISDIHIGSIKA